MIAEGTTVQWNSVVRRAQLLVRRITRLDCEHEHKVIGVDSDRTEGRGG